jgi:hypothetical protein
MQKPVSRAAVQGIAPAKKIEESVEFGIPDLKFDD